LLNSGVVEGTIEPTEGRQRPLDHRFDVALFGDVGSDEDRLAAGGRDPGDNFLAGSLTASADDDLRALLGKFDCGGTADPGIATSDEYDSACNPTHEILHAPTRQQGRCRSTPTPESRPRSVRRARWHVSDRRDLGTCRYVGIMLTAARGARRGGSRPWCETAGGVCRSCAPGSPCGRA